MTHQMWCEHPFSQRNRTTERTVGVRVGGDRKWGRGARGWWTKFLKKGEGVRQYRGVLNRWLSTPLPTM